MQIGSSVPILQIFHVAETSMMFKQLLRVCVKKFIFLARILDITFPFKMSVGKTLVGLKKLGKLFLTGLLRQKGNCGLFSPVIAWFKVSAA